METVPAAARCRAAYVRLKTNLDSLGTGQGNSNDSIAETALLVVELKSSSRATHLGVDAWRQKVLEYKRVLDDHHLTLQNLLYRKAHLLRELALCHDFKTEKVEKIEREENIVVVGNGDDLTSPEHHTRRLKMLSGEMAERERLEVALQAAKAQQDAIESSIDSSRAFLAGLPGQLRHVQSAMEPLKSSFGIGSEDGKLGRAKELSAPLYVLFRQFWAAGAEKDLEIVDAVPISTALKKAVTTEHQTVGEAQEDGSGERNSKRSKMSDGAGLHDSSYSALEVEDLAILLTIRCSVDGAESADFVLRFQRVVPANAITVEVLDNPPSLLAHLLPGDKGISYPNVVQDDIPPFPATAAARPYLWAQFCAGLEVLPENFAAATLKASSHKILRLLRDRIESHLLLSKQLESLKSNHILVHPSAEATFPPITEQTPVLESWVESGVPECFDGDGLCFVATFKGPELNYEVNVSIPSAYPEVPPQFIAKTQNAIGDLVESADAAAKAANFGETGPWALSHQLRRIQGTLGTKNA